MSMYARAMAGRPETRYARSGAAHIAYQVIGEGLIDLIVAPGFISHLDLQWESVTYRHFVRRLATFSRVIRYDKRGTGLSDPVVEVPTLAERVDDLRAVLDAASSTTAILLGYSEGGPTAIQFSVTERERTRGLVLYGTVCTPPPAEAAQRFRDAVARWGSGVILEMFSPSLIPTANQLETAGGFERAAASPAMAAALMETLIQTDVQALLPEVAVPTFVVHRQDDFIDVAQGRYIAAHIPGAEYLELEGSDHLPWVGDAEAVLVAVERFVTRLGGRRVVLRAGPQPRSQHIGAGWDSLTSAERTVATLVAEGLSNPAIANRLVISRHTVESHLKHAYAKLGLSSRVELATVTLRHHVNDP
jgi:pimeloyl-ACP methyl ester carboxylesterase/DNA-binding CsgD family transcriptional regulator